MNITKNVKATVNNITNDDGYYFFGYYDLQPFSSDDCKHLCHKVKFMDRLPTKDDICEIGYIDLSNNRFCKLTETTAWNFQQGALLQWYKDDEHIAYNVRGDRSFHTEIMNIITGEKRRLPMAAANISQNGKFALCINFSRIYDFRPGYGYSDVPDKFANENAPKGDGVYLMNMETGETKMIINYKDITEQFPEKPYSDCKLVINHITFNPNGDRFLFLLRNFRSSDALWKTQLITSDLDGNMCLLSDYISNSHYNWKNNSQILIVTSYGGTMLNNLCLRDDFTGNTLMYDFPELHKDIHCLYSPDKRYILGDGYPDENRYRNLWLFDTEKQKATLLLSDYSFKEKLPDIRCDLHARWNHKGDKITFDSNHTGGRCVCMMDLKSIIK